jgi:hypothetical protein
MKLGNTLLEVGSTLPGGRLGPQLTVTAEPVLLSTTELVRDYAYDEQWAESIVRYAVEVTVVGRTYIALVCEQGIERDVWRKDADGVLRKPDFGLSRRVFWVF